AGRARRPPRPQRVSPGRSRSPPITRAGSRFRSTRCSQPSSPPPASSSKHATLMSDGATAGFLATLPLLEGRNESDIADLARVLRRRDVPAGETLWHQGEEARELLLIVRGAVSASLHDPGGRVVEIGRAGAGEMVGELALLDGGGHTMNVHATEPAT